MVSFMELVELVLPLFTEPPIPNMHSSSSCYSMLRAGFLLGLLFSPDNGGDLFLRNVGWLSTDYMALHPRR
jgi:hypothetical protein